MSHHGDIKNKVSMAGSAAPVLSHECAPTAELLELYVLQGLEMASMQTVETHAASCPTCSERLRALQGAADRLKAAMRNGESGRAAIRLSVAREIAQIKRWRTLRRGAGLLARAAILVAVICCGTVWALFAPSGTRETTPHPTLAWQYEGVSLCRGINTMYPLVRGDTLFALQGKSSSMHTVAISKNTGKTMWTSPFRGECGLSADTSHVFVWRTTGRGPLALVAADIDTGAMHWQFEHASPVGGLMNLQTIVFNGGVCWTEENRIYCVDADTGALRWTRDISGQSLLSIPAAANSRLYVASHAELCAIDAQTGRVEWRHPYESQPSRFSAPILAVDGNRVFVAQRRLSTEGNLWCHDALTGDLRWQTRTGLPASIQVLGEHVYVRSAGLEAFDKHSGRPLWQAGIDGCSPIASGHGLLYAVTGYRKDRILALDPATGRTVMEHQLAGSCSGLVVDGNMGYLSGHNGTLYALGMGS